MRIVEASVNQLAIVGKFPHLDMPPAPDEVPPVTPWK
jgi:hypothetical protein